MRRSILYFFLVIPGAWAGCSTDRISWNGEDKTFGGVDAGESSGDAGCSGVVCSKDLRSVRDCDGNLVKECPEDTACGNGECIAPCEAAAINEGSVGCSFAIPWRNSDLFGGGSCAAFFVANNWTSPATLRLEFKGEEQPLDGAVWVPYAEDGVVKHRKLDGPIPPGEGAVIFLSNEQLGTSSWVACPKDVKPVFAKDQAVWRTGMGHVMFASADVPVAMYSMFPYGGGKSAIPSATLLFPTTSFRKNYIAISSWGGKSDTFGVAPGARSTQPGVPTLQIVATEDDTSIDIVPKVDITGGEGIRRSAKNSVVSYKLQRGEVMQIAQHQELVGSVVEASKPIGMFGGSTCMNVPGDKGWCDVDNKQIPPISAWGHEYAVLPAPGRVSWLSRGKDADRDLSVIRMVGAVDGTKLVYEPSRPEGAPETLESGQLARFFTYQPFVVRSEGSGQPFFVASLMTAGSGTGSYLGDPETMIVVPTDQWLDSYGFFSDSTYRLSALFVTRRKLNGEFRDVTLDCAGVLTGWRSITDDYEWTYAELSRTSKPVAYPDGTCTDGAHRVRSDAPFSMAVWGIDQAASYGYPGGAGLRPITEVHVPAIVH